MLMSGTQAAGIRSHIQGDRMLSLSPLSTPEQKARIPEVATDSAQEWAGEMGQNQGEPTGKPTASSGSQEEN